ncbi:MAG TPA: transcriptional regulator [Shinella sp.]|uniref:helix-turn-helix transcriptional regulator n=1 Tax=Shinella sp. TaxID=1870904 RepID=UPI002E1566A2|nr:transcriptional regulator [Shinella sp.]
MLAKPHPVFKRGRMTSSENDPSRLPELTEIEKRCLQLAANGRTPADIVLETDIAMPRVTEATRSAIDKLGTRNITAAIVRATRLNLI